MIKKNIAPVIRCGPVTTGQGIPVTVICGFLGSGKTTLLRRWQLAPSLENPTYVVDDHSGFGIDTKLLSHHTSQGKKTRPVHQVTDGERLNTRDINCATLDDILAKISKGGPAPSQVFCESAGSARPWSLIGPIIKRKDFHLRHFIVTIDALNFHRDFADGKVLIGEAEMSPDIALHYAAGIIAEQLLFASAIILTKTDTIPPKAIDTQARVLRALQPDATIGLSTLDGFGLAHLDVSPVPNVTTLKNRAEQFGLDDKRPMESEITAVNIEDPRPFHPERLYNVFQQQLATGIYRTKGLVWLASRPNDTLLFQQSGSQIAFEDMEGVLPSTQNQSSKSGGERVDQHQNRTKIDRPSFGNRTNTLTLFGLPSACGIFSTALRSALCTEEEIIAWKDGAVFHDPWPKTQ